MLLLRDADVVDLATDCCYDSHQTEGSLFSESLAPDLKSQSRWSLSSGLAHNLCHSCQNSWKSKNLSFFTAIMEMALFPRKTHMVGNSPNIEREVQMLKHHSLIGHNKLILSKGIF